MSRRPPWPASIRFPARHRRFGIGLLLAGVLVGGIVCARTRSRVVPEDDYTRYHNRSFRVARVVDGDTLDIAVPDGARPTTRIRLWGVDTPEMARAGKPTAYFAPEATAFARETLENRTVHVVLSPKQTRGKYGRLLAYVYLTRGGPMFNEMLLERGYAYADFRFPHHYFDRFKTIEKLARRAGVGLWADVTLDQMPSWRQRFERKAAKRKGN